MTVECSNSILSTKLKESKRNMVNGKVLLTIKDIVNSLTDHEQFFPFANFSFHLFAYAIKLYPNYYPTNEVIVMCGNEYKKIADSFFKFANLYLNNSEYLQF